MITDAGTARFRPSHVLSINAHGARQAPGLSQRGAHRPPFPPQRADGAAANARGRHGQRPRPASPAFSAASANPSENELGTVTTALLDFFTVSYCMSIVRSLRAASGSP